MHLYYRHIHYPQPHSPILQHTRHGASLAVGGGWSTGPHIPLSPQ
jgi:hypothetical protein